MKTIAVLMSVYNGQKYIREQLESILKQDVTADGKAKIVLYIRVDGSKDGSAEIIREYADRMEIWIYEEENLGPERSFWRLMSLATATADYYAFADQDDYWFPDKLSRGMACLKKEDPEIPCLYCTALQPTDEHLNPIPHEIGLDPYTDLPHALIYSLSAGCTFLFNRAAFLLARKYDMETQFVEMHDWLLHKIVAMTGKVHYDPKPSLYYRQHGGNVIGERTTGLRHLTIRANRILNESQCVRSRNAEAIREVYADYLKDHPQEKHMLDLVADYRKNRAVKREFLREKAFRVNTKKDLIFKALILWEKI